MEEDEADLTIIAKTLEVEKLFGDNQLAIAETNEQLLTMFFNLCKADNAMETQCPQPLKEPGTKDATRVILLILPLHSCKWILVTNLLRFLG